jgi:hypothetical protein
MDHALRVRIIERGGDLSRDRERILERQLPLAPDPVEQRLAIDARHRVVQASARPAPVEQWQDVRMVEAPLDLDLPEEARGADRRGHLRTKDLQRDGAIVNEVVCAIHHSHAALAEQVLDRVAVRQRALELFDLRDLVPVRGERRAPGQFG